MGGVGKCPSCGVQVGGQGYNRFIGNGRPGEGNEAQLRDETKTGHFLGPVPRHFERPRPEREMGALQVAMTRFVMHAAMAIGEFKLHPKIVWSPVGFKARFMFIFGYICKSSTN